MILEELPGTEVKNYRGGTRRITRYEREKLPVSQRTAGCTLCGHKAVLDGVLDQFGTGLNIKALHDPVLVEFDGSCRNIQKRSDFFSRLTLCQEL